MVPRVHVISIRTRVCRTRNLSNGNTPAQDPRIRKRKMTTPWRDGRHQRGAGDEAEPPHDPREVEHQARTGTRQRRPRMAQRRISRERRAAEARQDTGGMEEHRRPRRAAVGQAPSARSYDPLAAMDESGARNQACVAAILHQPRRSPHRPAGHLRGGCTLVREKEFLQVFNRRGSSKTSISLVEVLHRSDCASVSVLCFHAAQDVRPPALAKPSASVNRDGMFLQGLSCRVIVL